MLTKDKRTFVLPGSTKVLAILHEAFLLSEDTKCCFISHVVHTPGRSLQVPRRGHHAAHQEQQKHAQRSCRALAFVSCGLAAPKVRLSPRIECPGS